MPNFSRRVPVLCAATAALLIAAGSTGAGEIRRSGESLSSPVQIGGSDGFAVAQAEDPLVCCYKRQPGGALLFFLAPKSQCKPGGGREVAMARCNRPGEPQVCCATPNGFLTLSRGQCRQAGRETSPESCRGSGLNGPRVCCSTRDGFVSMSRQACTGAGGRVALAVRCSPRALVCCKVDGPGGNATYRLVTARACKNADGTVAIGRFCRNALGLRNRDRTAMRPR